MKKVYISYDKSDKKKADEIFEYFERNGISCFMAPDSIPEGETYASSVPKVIKKCDLFLLILSDKVQKSSWIPKEIELAIEEKKKIIPFQVEECVINDTYKFYFGSTNIVDGMKDYVEKLDEIVLTVKKEKKVESKKNIGKEKTVEIEKVKKETKKKDGNAEAKKDSKKQEEKETPRKIGEAENIKPENGIGKYHYPNGDFYQGEWADGKKCGFGILRITGVGFFYAVFNDDKAESGILALPDGTITMALWKENGEIVRYETVEEKMQKYPQFYKRKKYKNGDEFYGETFWGAKANGIYKYANGEKYIGYWQANKKEGFGTYYYNEQELYTGFWNRGKKEGLGIQVSKEGDLFLGTFKKDMSIIGIKRAADGKLTSEERLEKFFIKGSGDSLQVVDAINFDEDAFSSFKPLSNQSSLNVSVGMIRKVSGENQCPLCHGYGKVNRINQLSDVGGRFITCPRCKGKGEK